MVSPGAYNMVVAIKDPGGWTLRVESGAWAEYKLVDWPLTLHFVLGALESAPSDTVQAASLNADSQMFPDVSALAMMKLLVDVN